MVEGARLESEYTPKAYRGFESLPLRHIAFPAVRAPGFERGQWELQALARAQIELCKGLSGKLKTLWRARSAMMFPVPA